MYGCRGGRLSQPRQPADHARPDYYVADDGEIERLIPPIATGTLAVDENVLTGFRSEYLIAIK